MKESSVSPFCGGRLGLGLPILNAVLMLVALLTANNALSAKTPRPAPGVFFVSPKGNDSWSGSRPSVNSRHTDGPFATVPHALVAAREWRKQQSPGITNAPALYLLAGTYFLSTPLVLEPQDSGLTIAAYDEEKPTLSGGRLITAWKPVTVSGRRLWAAQIPEVKEGKWYFRELWVNGRRAVRARYPHKGYLSIAEPPDKTKEWTQGQTRVRYRPGEISPWKTINEADLVVMNRWAESHLPIVSVDETNDIINLGKRSVFQLEKDDLFYVEGVFEALTSPGDWYLERGDGTLYYYPREGETISGLEAVAPVLAQVVRLEGEPESSGFVQGITFRGICFGHTEWYFPGGFENDPSKPHIWPPPNAEVGGFGQAAIGVPGAVWGQGVKDTDWINCEFVHLGDYGLELARGCQNNQITSCEFADLGAGGVKLGETSIRSKPSEQAGNNELSNCSIHDGGKIFHSAIGVWIGQSPNNRLTHNSIHDFYYTGISIGWTWGYGPSIATNNLVAFNVVHHIGKTSAGDGPILSDMGGIYTLGMQPGTRILNNLWHDVQGIRYGGWGIYFDEGSSGIVAESNIVYRTTHGGFHQHYGATNLVANNIFAFARDHQLQRSRQESHVSFSFVTNIVYFDFGVLLGGSWSNDQFKMDWNTYFDARPGAKPLKFLDASFEQWRGRGHDGHSINADPLFVAPREFDFRLRPKSPVFKEGFQPIDMSKVGPRAVAKSRRRFGAGEQ